MTAPTSEQSIFLHAIGLGSKAERDAYLDDACRGSPGLRAELDALIAAHDRLGSPPPEAVAGGGPAATGGYDPSPAAPGQVVGGRYKLLEEVGEGGMGRVWLAEQREPVKRLVALKVVKPGMDSKQVVARFEAERQALALMDHPNIAKVLEGGATPDGRPFFVMELVKGVPITRYCDDHRLAPRDRLRLFADVCGAVQHAHQKGVIHRDLKPSNVLVAPHDGVPVVRVIDFGVAKAAGQPLTEKTLFTGLGAVVGTPEYMSPEQAELNQLDVDTRSDVYALGVLLYELLTGTTPLTRKRVKEAALLEVLRIIREEEPPRPSTRLSESKDSLPAVSAQRQTEPARLTRLVRGELDWIVMKALEKDRSWRYDTAIALARDVERYLADEPVEAGPPSAGYRLRKLARRHRRPLAAAAAAVALLAAAAGVSTWQAVRATRAEAAARADRDEKEWAQAAEADRRRDQAMEEKRRADEQAAIARAVTEFLQRDLLGQADAANQPGGADDRDADVTVRTLLGWAARGVGGRFAGQPLTEAAVRRTLGSAYAALGVWAEAEDHLGRAVQLYREHRGADHPDTLAARYDLAKVYTARLRLDRARRLPPNPELSGRVVGLLREVIDGRTRRLGPDHPDTLDGKRALAEEYAWSGRHNDLARSLYAEVVGALIAHLGKDHPQTLAAAADLYLSRWREGGGIDREAAREGLKYLRGAVHQSTARLGADHPETIDLVERLGRGYMKAYAYSDAVPPGAAGRVPDSPARGGPPQDRAGDGPPRLLARQGREVGPGPAGVRAGGEGGHRGPRPRPPRNAGGAPRPVHRLRGCGAVGQGGGRPAGVGPDPAGPVRSGVGRELRGPVPPRPEPGEAGEARRGRAGPPGVPQGQRGEGGG